MAGLSKKDQQRVLDHVESQGVNVVATKSGYLMRFPNGNTAMMHKSESDSKAPLALRAQLRRNNITWPFDAHKELAAYVAEGAPSKKTMELHKQILGSPLPDVVYPSELAREFYEKAHPGKPVPAKIATTTTLRALHALNYVPTGQYEHNRGKGWVLKLEEPKPQPAVERPKPVVPASMLLPEPVAAENAEPTVTVEVKSEAPAAAPKVEEREFLDTVDSWTVDVDELDEITAQQLVRTLKASGLRVEIRVWRATH